MTNHAHVPTELPTRTAVITAAVLLIVASFITFGAAVTYGFLDFDDSYLIVNNLAIRGPTPSHLWTIFSSYDPELYIPVTLFTYQLNYLIAGLHPFTYHFTNILLHGLNAFLCSAFIFLFLRDKKIAFFFGLLFAIHPLNTEAAVWASARKDTLSTFFLLSSLVSYLLYAEGQTKRLWWLSLSLYFLAALSKSSVMVFPLFLPLVLLLKNGRIGNVRQRIAEWSPFGVIAFLTGIIAFYGKTRVITSATFSDTVLLAAKSTVFYLQKIFVPLNLTAIYPYSDTITLASPDFFVPLIILILICTACIALWKKTSWPLICFLLFVLTIAPSFFNTHKGTQIFFAVDRYAYLGMIWILLLFAALSLDVVQRLGKKGTLIFAVTLVVALVLLSHKQTTYWKDDRTILTHALSLYPESVSARTGLAAVERGAGRMDLELSTLQKGLEYSEDTALLLGIGSVYARQNKLQEAEGIYVQASSKDPKNPEPFFYLGALREQQGKSDEAEVLYKKAIELDESYVAAYNNLGSIFMDAGKYSEAAAEFMNALAWNQNFFEGQYNLFQALEYLKKNNEAFTHLELAYQLRDDIPDIGLSYAYRLQERGKIKEAINVLTHVLEIDPENHTAKRLFDQLQPAMKQEKPTLTEEERRSQRMENRLQDRL